MSSPSATAPTDWAISIQRFGLYPEETWFCLATFLFVVGLFQWGSILHSKLVKRCRPNKASDEESTSSSARPPKRLSLARLPLAAVNVYRVVAFRWTLEFGSYVINMAEVFVTLAYIVLLLTWTFINSTYQIILHFFSPLAASFLMDI
jgi:ferric-chelate reductase